MEHTNEKLAELSTEELHALFHHTNSLFSQNLMSGANFDEQTCHIERLGLITAALNSRRNRVDEDWKFR